MPIFGVPIVPMEGATTTPPTIQPVAATCNFDITPMTPNTVATSATTIVSYHAQALTGVKQIGLGEKRKHDGLMLMSKGEPTPKRPRLHPDNELMLAKYQRRVDDSNRCPMEKIQVLNKPQPVGPTPIDKLSHEGMVKRVHNSFLMLTPKAKNGYLCWTP